MNEWITDRRPTYEEADGNYGMVLEWIKECDGGRCVIRHWQHVDAGSPWMPMPKPYQPPEPDTSLSASIERVENSDWSGPYFDSELFSQDHARIIEAARKWGLKEKAKEFANSTTDDYDIGESEYGKKYEERTGSGYKSESPAVSSGDKPKRREWWVETGSRNPKSFNDAWYAWGMNSTFRPQDYTHVREVFDDDPDPEWVDEASTLLKLIVNARDDMNLFAPKDEKAEILGRLIEDARDHLAKHLKDRNEK